MKKAEMKAIAEKYGFEIIRNPITMEAWALRLETTQDIPELDSLMDAWHPTNVAVTKEYGVHHDVRGTHVYKVVCPVTWFDLAGWC